MTLPEELPADGRRARSVVSRARAADAVLVLVATTAQVPGWEETAEESGLAVRSLHRLFEDPSDLLATATRLLVERSGVHEVLGDEPSVGVADRLDALVDRRTRPFEMLSAHRALVVGCGFIPGPVADEMGQVGRAMRREIDDVFGPELRRRRGASRNDLAATLDTASSWRVWDAMRAGGAGRQRVAQTQRRVLGGLLGLDLR